MMDAFIKAFKSEPPWLKFSGQFFDKKGMRIRPALILLISLSYFAGIPTTTPLAFASSASTRGKELEIRFEKFLKNPAPNSPEWVFFNDPARVQEMYFEKPAKKLALWQIENRVPVHELQTQSKGLNLNDQRKEILILKKTLDEQFYSSSSLLGKKVTPLHGLTDQILDDLEQKLLTTASETKLLDQSRSSVKSGYESSEQLIKSSRLNLLEKINVVKGFPEDEVIMYLLGLSKEVPQPKRTSYFKLLNPLNDKATRDLEIFRRELLEAPPSVRAKTIENVYQKVAPSKEVARKLILKDLDSDPTLRSVFDAFYEAYPKEVQAKMVGEMASALGTEAGIGIPNLNAKTISELAQNASKDASKSELKFSLKKALETRGAFGIKMGQSIHSLRLVDGPLQEELAQLLNEADTPTRREVIERTLEAFKNSPQTVKSVGPVIGSGSVNYVVQVTLEGPKTKKLEEAIIRFQRKGVQEQALKENQYLTKALNELMKNEHPQVRDLAVKGQLAKNGAMKTLEIGGSEMDLSLERTLYPEARSIYDRGAYQTKSGYSIQVSKPLDDFQKLIPESLQQQISIYSFEENTSWKKLKATLPPEKLKEISYDIANTELDAIFKGHFDKDGHMGNWLVDPKRNKIIRIDTAQLTKINSKDLEKFKEAIKLVVNPYTTQYDAKKLSNVLDGLFSMEGGETLWSPKMVNDIIHDPKLLKAAPEERLFVFRDLLEERVKMPVSIRPHANDAMIALSKLKGFEEHMGETAFKKLLVEKLYKPQELVKAGVNFLRECTAEELFRALLLKPRK